MPLHTFILRIGEPTATGYPVELLRDDESPFDPPAAAVFAATDLAALPLTVPGVPSDVRDAESPPPAAGPVGLALHNLLIRGKVKEKWDALRQAYPRDRGPSDGRRIILEVIPKNLRAVPWERMGAGELFIARDAGNALVRGPLRPDAPRLPPLDGPLRVLVVVGSEPGDKRVLAEDELAELEKTFWTYRHRIEYRVLAQPSREQIADECGTFLPHVFHFIGHGRLVKGDPPTAHLELFGQSPPVWGAADIYNDLSPAAGPLRFAFLNACHTAADAGGELWSLADTFFQLDAGAVLAMQGPVPGASAAFLSGTAYWALASGQALDLALTGARVKLATRYAGQSDWAIPALHLQARPEHVLPLARPFPPELLDDIRAAFEFRHNAHFVDRHAQRGELLGRMGAAEPPRPGRLVIVRGARAVGKSGLLQYCLEACVLWGQPVKYLNLDGRPTDFLQLLRRIRDGDAGVLLDQPLPAAAFAAFNRTVNALLDGADPRALGVLAGYPDADRMRPLPAASRPRNNAAIPRRSNGRAARGPAINDLVEHLFQTFIACLDRATAAPPGGGPARPLLLVLDQTSELVGGGLLLDVFKLVLRRLAVPFAHRKIPGAVLVLAADNDEYEVIREVFAEARLTPDPMTVDLPTLSAAEFTALAGEFCRRRGIPDAVWRPVVTELAGGPTFANPNGWSPASLKQVSDVLPRPRNA